MNKKILSWLFILILLIFKVVAQDKCPPTCSDPSSITSDSYNNQDSYGNEDFIMNSDPKQWKFDKISNWDNPSLQKRFNSDKTARGAYLNHFGFNCVFDSGNQNQLKYGGDGIKHPKGAILTKKDVPSGSLVTATDDGFDIRITSDIDLDKNPSAGITIDTNGHKLTLPDKTTVEGRISYKEVNGDIQAYVKKNDKVTINEVEVTTWYIDVDLFFDGQEHSGNYVSFGNKNVVIQGDNFFTTFSEGNNYVDVNNKENDRLVVSPINNGKITITKESGKAPEVVVTGPKDKKIWARIKNGRYDSGIGNFGLLRVSANQALSSEYGSVSMEIKIINDEGNNLIVGEDGQDAKIIIDNSNRLQYASEGAIVGENGKISCKDEKPCMVGQISYLYSRDKLIRDLDKFGRKHKIGFYGLLEWTDFQIIAVTENLERLSTEFPDLMRLYDRDEFEKKWVTLTGDGDFKKGQKMYKFVAGSDDPAFVRKYGGTEPREDIATYLEHIAAGGTLINEKQRKKARLLCEYGFIPDSHNVCS